MHSSAKSVRPQQAQRLSFSRHLVMRGTAQNAVSTVASRGILYPDAPGGESANHYSPERLATVDD
jgi:hypothetical protein